MNPMVTTANKTIARFLNFMSTSQLKIILCVLYHIFNNFRQNGTFYLKRIIRLFNSRMIHPFTYEINKISISSYK